MSSQKRPKKNKNEKGNYKKDTTALSSNLIETDRPLMFGIEEMIMDKVNEQTKDIFQQTSGNRALIGSLINAYDHVDAIVNVWRTPAIADKLQCKKGCSYCCHFHIGVLAPEAISIAQYMIDTLSNDRLSSFKAQLNYLMEKTKGYSVKRWGQENVACIFLREDGTCHIYEIRPFSCRGMYSFNLKQCHNSFHNPHQHGHIEQPAVPVNILSAAQAGLFSGIEGGQHQLEVMELHKAVNIAINDDKLVEKWLAGERVFKDAYLSSYDTERLLTKTKVYQV